jgi:hypothetical protein
MATFKLKRFSSVPVNKIKTDARKGWGFYKRNAPAILSTASIGFSTDYYLQRRADRKADGGYRKKQLAAMNNLTNQLKETSSAMNNLNNKGNNKDKSESENGSGTNK